MATQSGRNSSTLILPPEEVVQNESVGPDFVLPPPKSLLELLFKDGDKFSFFQAVRLLEQAFPERRPVGRGGPPGQEVVRFRAYQSLSFPASSIYSIDPPEKEDQPPTMQVTFMGLTGPSGVLPRHYTELIVNLYRETKGPERTALRDWLDIFNHRMISLFYRAWGKYRIYFPYGRQEFLKPNPDLFTQALYSFVGLGLRSLRNRLRVSFWEIDAPKKPERPLARVQDLALIFYGGLLNQKPRSAGALQKLLDDNFQLPIEVKQFQGQWLRLAAMNQSQLGETQANSSLGMNTVAGEQVWDVMGRFRLRVGPLNLKQFTEFIPDRSPIPQRKSFFLLVHLIRLFVGPDLSFDVKMVLSAEEVPECRLEADEEAVGACLGWNTWLVSQEFENDAEDAVFEGEEMTWVNY